MCTLASGVAFLVGLMSDGFPVPISSTPAPAECRLTIPGCSFSYYAITRIVVGLGPVLLRRCSLQRWQRGGANHSTCRGDPATVLCVTTVGRGLPCRQLLVPVPTLRFYLILTPRVFPL